MKPKKVKPLKIHVGKNGGVRVDAKELLAQPGVQKRLKFIKEMNLAGKKLVGNKLVPIDTDSEKTPKRH